MSEQKQQPIISIDHVSMRFNLAKGLTFTTTNGVDYYDAKSYSFASKRVSPSNSMGNNDTYRI